LTSETSVPAVAALPAGPPAPDLAALARIAAGVRADCIRAVHLAQGGHLGGPLSCADILVALYFAVLDVRPGEPHWPERDRFILSKGHSAIGLYATLAARGFFPREELWTFDAIDSRLQGHPDMTKLPGLDMSTGSLGQGLSPGLGMALAARRLGQSWHTWVLLGDGECQEGQIWEAAMSATHHRLDSLTVLVDNNGIQADGATAGVMGVEPVVAKFQSFGFDAETVNPHDHGALLRALRARTDRPRALVLPTIPGHGVPSFVSHHKVHYIRAPDAVWEAAQAELESAAQR